MIEKIKLRFDRNSIFTDECLNFLTEYFILSEDSADIRSCVIMILSEIRSLIREDIVDDDYIKEILKLIREDIDLINYFDIKYPDIQYDIWEFIVEVLLNTIKYAVELEEYETAYNLNMMCKVFPVYKINLD